jgi:hypothetical protein
MRKKSITEKDLTLAIICKAPWRLSKVESQSNYRLKVEFIDGTSGFVEMEGLILSQQAGVFEKLRDFNFFAQVYLEHGVVTWPGEIDLAPDAMYDEIKHSGKWILT